MTSNINITNTTTNDTTTNDTTTNDTTTKTISDNIKVVNKNKLYRDYNSNCYYYSRIPTNTHNFIVVEYGYDGEYVESLLLNIDLNQYLKPEHKYIFNFDVLYEDLENYNMFILNRFLGTYYKANDIEGFINKYEKYFIEKFKIDLMDLYNKMNKEVELYHYK